ncbi:MAG: ABC transporter permease [bacterium]
MNWTRIQGMVYRHLVLYKRSFPKILDVFFWPTMDLIVWGFVSIYILNSSEEVPGFVGFFLGAVIFWEILFRSNLGVAVGFLEDVWTRNFLNIFASPLKLSEFMTSLVISSFIRITIGTIFMIILAILFYQFNIAVIGLSLVLFFANLLLMGWSLGFIAVAIILRFGHGAEVLAWAFAFIFQPVSAVFYPVSVLPQILQKIAQFVPASHVFEGMREILNSGTFLISEFIWAMGLNLVYLSAAITLVYVIFKQAKMKGRLTRYWQ